MVRIPAGCFVMGSPSEGKDKDSDPFSNEHPQHRVCLSGFRMDATEVTQSAYQGVVGTNPSESTSCGGNCPVENVSWEEAKSYCERVGKRLPTEAEWEYAARAGTTTRYHWGNDIARAGDYAWNESNSGEKAHPVGQKLPNAWGLYDMAGNVSEWTADLYDEEYYSQSPSQDPRGPNSSAGIVLRGGSWGFPPILLYSAHREYVGIPGDGDGRQGFRCAGP